MSETPSDMQQYLLDGLNEKLGLALTIDTVVFGKLMVMDDPENPITDLSNPTARNTSVGVFELPGQPPLNLTAHWNRLGLSDILKGAERRFEFQAADNASEADLAERIYSRTLVNINHRDIVIEPQWVSPRAGVTYQYTVSGDVESYSVNGEVDIQVVGLGEDTPGGGTDPSWDQPGVVKVETGGINHVSYNFSHSGELAIFAGFSWNGGSGGAGTGVLELSTYGATFNPTSLMNDSSNWSTEVTEQASGVAVAVTNQGHIAFGFKGVGQSSVMIMDGGGNTQTAGGWPLRYLHSIHTLQDEAFYVVAHHYEMAHDRRFYKLLTDGSEDPSYTNITISGDWAEYHNIAENDLPIDDAGNRYYAVKCTTDDSVERSIVKILPDGTIDTTYLVQHSVPYVRYVVAADGSVIAVDENGLVHYYDLAGELRYSRPTAGGAIPPLAFLLDNEHDYRIDAGNTGLQRFLWQDMELSPTVNPGHELAVIESNRVVKADAVRIPNTYGGFMFMTFLDTNKFFVAERGLYQF